MASFPLNRKAQYHVRSISLPSRSHPLVPEFDEHLCRLRASQAASSSSSSTSISQRLRGLKDLYDCVDDLLPLPLIQKTFAQHHHDKLVDELVDGSLGLLDVCGTAKDALLQTREHCYELQSSLRRRRGSANGISSEVGKYLTSRKNVLKSIHKAIKTLKGIEKKCSFCFLNQHSETIYMVDMLKEVETVTLTVLESLLSSISGAVARSKPSRLSLVSRLTHQKRVACEEAAGDFSEFEKVDSSLFNFISHRSANQLHVDTIQNALGELVSSAEDLEEGIEFLSRNLVKTRVSLLNILGHQLKMYLLQYYGQ